MGFRFTTGTKKFNSGGNTRGSGIATFVFFVFFLFGLIFFGGLGFHFYNVFSTYSWQPVEGEILSSSIIREMEDATDTNLYKFKVEYQYSINGKTFSSSRLRISNAEFESYEAADNYLQQFSEGKKVTVFVDPEVYGESVLVHDSPWMVLFLLIPLVFMTVGAVGLISLRRSKKRADSPAIAAKELKQIRRRPGRFLLVPLGLIFVVAGSVVFYFILDDITSALNRDSFKPVPCTILASDIITIESEDSEGRRSRSYKPDIFYKCDVAGKTVRASRFRFLNTSGSRRNAEEIIENYSAGKKVTGYVNPDNSRDIVLNRDYGAGALIALLPPIFIIVGFAVFCAGISGKGSTSVESPGTWRSAPAATPDRSPRPAELSPDGTRRGAVAGVLFFALFWNGITGIFVYHAAADWLSGSGSIFLSIMLIPFVLIGLFLILLFFHQLLSSFNPVIKLNISNIHPAAGEDLTVHWRVEGKVDRLSNIVMLLEGEERATYQRGTDTFTAQNTFYRKKLLPEAHGRVSQSGSFNFQVPADSMHSFEALNNEIAWKIIVRGEIRRWPDAKETYILNVGPARREE